MTAFPDSSTTSAYLVGVLFGFGLCLLGALKCFSIARRPTTNTKAAAALGMVLLGWACLSLARQLQRGAFGEPSTAGFLGMSALGFVVVIVGATLGILGLGEIRARPGAYRQGRAQAIWSLVLAAIVLLGVGYGFVKAARERDEIPAHLGPMAVEPGTPITLSELNCELTMPRDWVSYDAAAVQPDAALGLIRANPQAFFMVIAERIGVDAELSTAALAELAHANAKSAATSAELGEWRAEALDGIEGLQASSKVVLRGRQMWFDHWVGTRGGFCYQLLTWTDARKCSREETERHAREVRRGFRQIDPERVVFSSGEPAPPELESERFGYTLALEGSWTSWDSLADDFPEAELGVLGVGRALSVVPIALPSLAIDGRHVASALLGCLDVDGPPIRERTRRGDLEQLDFDLSREGEDGERYDYRLRVLVGERAAWLVAAWATAGTVAAEEFDRWLDGFRGDPRVVPPEPDAWTDTERARHAGVFARLGESLAREGAEAAAVAVREQAVACAPDDADQHIALLHALLGVGRYEDTVRATERGLRHHPDNLALRSFRPFARAHLGEQDEAVAEFEEMFRAGYRDVHDLRFCTQVMSELGRGAEAVALVEHVLDGGSSTEMRILLAELLAERGEAERAIAELEQERARRPFHGELEWALLHTYADAERHRDARDVAERLIARDHDAADAYAAKARAEYHLGWYRRAKETLQAAIARYGAETAGLDEWLDAVNGMLGEGSNRLLREVVDPVAVPELGAAPEPAAGLGDHDVVVLDRVTAYRFVAGEELRTTLHSKILVRTPAGVSRFSSLRYSFDPLSQSIHVNRLIVRDPGGREVARGELADYFVLDDQSSGFATQDQQVQIPVPGLAAGHTIEVMVTYLEATEPEAMRFVECSLSSYYPTARASVVITGDVELVAHVATPGLEPATRDGALLWTVDQPPVFVAEPHQPDRDPAWPTLWLGGHGRTWSEVARRHLEEIADRLEPDAAVVAAAAELADGVEDPGERALVLARHVQSEITYRAIEFGSRAQIPAPAWTTLEKRYGDCKDHALLLYHMLRAADVRAHLALIDTDAPLVEPLPSLDQFDHVIVFCPELRGGHFFDCTDKHLDVEVAAPIALAERSALVLDPDAPRFVTVPAYPLEAAVVRSDRDVELAAEGVARVRETLELVGYYASFMRGYLAGMDAEHQRLAIQREYARFLPGVEVESVTVDHQDELAEDLVVRCTYRVPGVLHAEAERTTGRIPASWARRYLELEHVDRRRSRFVIRYPIRFECAVTVHAAPDMTFAAGGGDAATEDRGRFGRLEREVELAANELTLRASLVRPAGEFAAADYREAAGFADDCFAALEPGFALSR